MIKVVNNHDRNKLSEGRNWGMGFTFLKKVKPYTYETVQPISCCKDFLNEVIFTEHTNVPASVYGLTTKEKLGLFDDPKQIYLTIKILPQQRKEDYTFSTRNYKSDVEILKNKHKILESNINFIESNLSNFKRQTKIKEANDGYFVVNVPINWTQSTHMISLYTFLLRSLMNCDKEFNSFEDLYSYLEESHKDFNQIEAGLIKSAIKRLKQADYCNSLGFMEYQDFEIYKKSSSSIHNTGMVNI